MIERRAVLAALAEECSSVAEAMERAVARELLPASVLDDPRRFVCAECDGRAIRVGDIVAFSDGYVVKSSSAVDMRAVGIVQYPPIGATASFVMQANVIGFGPMEPCATCDLTRLVRFPPTMSAFITWASLGFGLTPTEMRCFCAGGPCMVCQGAMSLTTRHGVDDAEALAWELRREMSPHDPAYNLINVIAWRVFEQTLNLTVTGPHTSAGMLYRRDGHPEFTQIPSWRDLFLMGIGSRVDGETLVLSFPLNPPPS